MTDEPTDGEMIPAVNEITAQALDEPGEYAGGERMCAILFDEDCDGHATDMDGNVALLFDEDCDGHATDMDGNVALLLTRAQAVEVRELMDEIAAELEDNDE